MRVKLSGSVNFLQEVETAMTFAADASVETGVRRRESAELQLGVQEVGDLIGALKDFAELAPILWAAAASLWKKLADKQPTAGAEKPAQVTIDITAPLKRVQVTITPTTTVEQITIQLR